MYLDCIRIHHWFCKHFGKRAHKYIDGLTVRMKFSAHSPGTMSSSEFLLQYISILCYILDTRSLVAICSIYISILTYSNSVKCGKQCSIATVLTAD